MEPFSALLAFSKGNPQNVTLLQKNTTKRIYRKVDDLDDESINRL